MKKALIIPLLSLLFAACAGDQEPTVEEIIASDDLESLRAKKAEIVSQQTEYAAQLKQLETRIAELDSNKKVSLVTSFQANEAPFDHFLELQGSVSTRDLLIIYPEYSGILTKVHVKEGDRVTEGQLLANIDDGGLSQQLAQLQIQADFAKTTYERQERLWKNKIGSEIQFLQAKSTYEAQEKAIHELQERLAKTQVKAPFSGIIDEVITERGSFVSPGQSQLMRIVNLDNMYIETDVPEKHITTVTRGKSVAVEFPALGRTVETRISQVGSFINPANRTFKVEIPLPNEDQLIKPNLTARLRINDYSNETALLVPQSVISENAEGEQYVYIVRDRSGQLGTAQKVIIETGKTQGGVIEVVSGLENGSEIIEEGARSVKDDQEVKVLNGHPKGNE